MTVLYDASEHIAPVLNGVDNLAVSAAHDLYVAEDGGNLEVCVITPERAVFPLVRMTGGQHGIDTGTPIPLISEVTGLALSPDGNRLYFNSERGMGIAGLPIGPGPGILYRSEEHTSELQSLMRISYAVFCLKKQTKKHN